MQVEHGWTRDAGGGGGGAGGSGDDEDQAKKQPIGDEEDEEESRESHEGAQQDATRGTGLYTYQLLVRTQRTDAAQHLLNDATAIITAAGPADLLTTSLSDTFALADRIVLSYNDLFDKDAEDETPASSQTSVYRNVWSSDDDNYHDHIFGEERQRYTQAIDQLLAGVAGGLGDVGGLGGSRAARHHGHGSDDAFHRNLQSAEDERSARLLAGNVGDGFGEAGEEELTARDDHQRARGFLAAESEEQVILAQNRRETQLAKRDQQVREQATAEGPRGHDLEYDISRILSGDEQFWASIARLNITAEELSPEAQSEEIRAVVDLLLKGDVGDGFGEAGDEELTARNDHQRARGFLATESEEQVILAQNRRETQLTKRDQQVREQATAERSRGQDLEYDISRILSGSEQFWASIAGLNITEEELSPEAQSEEIRAVVDLLFKNSPASSPKIGNSPAPASPVLVGVTLDDPKEKDHAPKE